MVSGLGIDDNAGSGNFAHGIDPRPDRLRASLPHHSPVLSVMYQRVMAVPARQRCQARQCLIAAACGLLGNRQGLEEVF
jgi:hypothetical protein